MFRAAAKDMAATASTAAAAKPSDWLSQMGGTHRKQKGGRGSGGVSSRGKKAQAPPSSPPPPDEMCRKLFTGTCTPSQFLWNKFQQGMGKRSRRREPPPITTTHRDEQCDDAQSAFATVAFGIENSNGAAGKSASASATATAKATPTADENETETFDVSRPASTMVVAEECATAAADDHSMTVKLGATISPHNTAVVDDGAAADDEFTPLRTKIREVFRRALLIDIQVVSVDESQHRELVVRVMWFNQGSTGRHCTRGINPAPPVLVINDHDLGVWIHPDRSPTELLVSSFEKIFEQFELKITSTTQPEMIIHNAFENLRAHLLSRIDVPRCTTEDLIAILMDQTMTVETQRLRFAIRLTDLTRPAEATAAEAATRFLEACDIPRRSKSDLVALIPELAHSGQREYLCFVLSRVRPVCRKRLRLDG